MIIHKLPVLLLIILSLVPVDLFGQNESSSTEFTFGLRGRRQTGNVNQLGLNPSTSFGFQIGQASTLLDANYDFLRINGNQVVSDLWLTGYFQGNTSKKIYPMARAFYGFAKSYRIDRSILGGVGLGTSLKSSERKFIEINAFAGYVDIDYDGAASHSAPAFGSLIKSSLPLIKNKLSLSWQLDTYHSLKDGGFWGLSNRVLLIYPLIKKISLNISHTTIFNNVVSDTIQRTNTLMLFGFMYQNN